MHYVVAHRVTEIIEIRDRKKFILGNLEPDLGSYEDGSYNIAHFVGRNEEKETKGFDWRKFANQYRKELLEDDEVLGYLTHLITDACWIKNIRQEYIRKYPKSQRPELTTKGYRDMYRYNSLFVHKYQLANEIHDIEGIAVKEADIQYKENLLSGLVSDFSQEVLEEVTFEVYPYEAIMAFIELSVQKSVEAILAIRMNQKLADPEEMYIPN